MGKSRGGWNTKIHMVSSDDRTAVAFALSPGQAHDAPEGRKLLEGMGKLPDAPAPGDPDGLERIAEWIIDCADGEELIARFGNGSDGGS